MSESNNSDTDPAPPGNPIRTSHHQDRHHFAGHGGHCGQWRGDHDWPADHGHSPRGDRARNFLRLAALLLVVGLLRLSPGFRADFGLDRNQRNHGATK